jgi:PAS domain S-box-containing protein
MYRTRHTRLLIRSSFGLAALLLVAIVVAGYLSLARGSPVGDMLILGSSVIALVLLMLSLLALRRDFTGRGRAESQLDRFFELSLDFLVISSVEGYFKRVSPAVQRVLGWTPEEFTSRPFIEFIHPDDVAKTLLEVERQMRSGEPVLHFENRYRHKNGSWRVLSWRSMPENGLMYATARDVTDSVAAAGAEREVRDLLELRVEQRTAELGAVNSRLGDQLQPLAGTL